MKVDERPAAPAARHAHAHAPALVWLALASVYVIWGSTYLAIRVAIRTLPPMLMASARFLVAGGVLYALTIRRGERALDRPNGRQWIAATIIGGTLLLGGNGGVVVAEQHISSGIAALLVATVPLWMAVIGWAVYKDRLTWPAIFGLGVGFLGLVILVGIRFDGWRPAFPSGAGRIEPLGVGLLMIATFSWAIGSLYSRRAPLPARPLVGTGMEMIAGGILLGIAGLARGELGAFEPSRVSWESALATAYLVVFGSLVAFSAYVWLLRVTRTSIVSTYAYVNPVVAVLLGWAMLGEPITVRTLIAGAVIVLGVALIVTARSAADERAGSPPDAPPPPENPEAASVK